MSCMMTYILHKKYKYTRAVYYYYDHFHPLPVRETRQQRHCGRSPKYVPSLARILVIHTLQLLEFFITIIIMHTLSPSDLPPLSHGHVKTRGMGGEGRTDATGAVGGGSSGSRTSARKFHLLM